MTSIEWTDETWNPSRGCRRVSAGCERCYAELQANRFKGEGQPYEGLVELTKNGVRWTGKSRFAVDALDKPLRWKLPRMVFVDSMSDLFYENFTDEEIAAVFGVMAACPQHTFQVLTKRPERMRAWFQWVSSGYGMNMRPQELITMKAAGLIDYRPGKNVDADRNVDPLLDNHRRVWPLPNVWIGVSVENQHYANERIPELMKTPAAIRFVSYEPALGPVVFQDTWMRTDWWSNAPVNVAPGLDWIIVGGESGAGARPFDLEWARSVIAQCKEARIACFFKQAGSNAHDSARAPSSGSFGDTHVRLNDRKGGDIREWADALRVREWPKVATP
jgi:protein gp37